MDQNFDKIQNMLRDRADLQARLNLIAYDGYTEINENSLCKYLYMRKRIAGRLRSEYVGMVGQNVF